MKNNNPHKMAIHVPRIAHWDDVIKKHIQALAKVHENAATQMKDAVDSARKRPALVPGVEISPGDLQTLIREGLQGKTAYTEERQMSAKEGLLADLVRKWFNPNFLSGLHSGWAFLTAPYTSGNPSAAQVATTPDWYPTSVAWASPVEGRFDVGVLADRQHGDSEFWGLHYSQAQASLTVAVPLLVEKPSTLTVYSGAVIDAIIQGLAVDKDEFAAAALQLFLVVTTAAGSNSDGVNVYFNSVKWGDPNPFFYETISGKWFSLTNSVDLPASSLVSISLSVNAVAYATKSTATGWNTYGNVDAEGRGRPDGLCKPKGEYYPLAGGIQVPFFAYLVEAK